MRTDERTGVQARERTHPGVPLAPGNVERRACASLRHGIRAFIVSCDRNDGGSLSRPHTSGGRCSGPCAGGGCHGSGDGLLAWCVTIAPSISPRPLSAGVRTSRGSQAHVVSWPFCVSRPIGWSFILLPCTVRGSITGTSGSADGSRPVLTRGSFTSVEDVQATMLTCLESDQTTMARPFTWTSQGKALMASTSG